MSNFTQALKELTGFDEVLDNAQDRQSGSSQLKKTQQKSFADEFEINDQSYERVVDNNLVIEKLDIHQGSTEISSTMAISGKITSDDDVIIDGYMAGDIATTGNAKITGVQVGTLKATSAVLEGGKVKGDLILDRNLVTDGNSAIVGNINANNIRISGKVKGDLDAKERIALLDNAMVAGNLVADTINTSPQARINGQIILRAVLEDFDIDVDFDMGGEM